MHANGNTYQALPGQQRQRRDSLAISERSSAPLLLHLNLDHDSDDPEAPNGSTGEMAGIYLGILNLFITLPQFVGTFISMVVFAILEPGKSKELAGDKGPDVTHPEPVVNAIGVCLFIGALSSLGAAYATHCFKHVR
jgi:solute carrier family 45 protein 1/2/4